MGDFLIKERNELFYVCDAGGHALATCDTQAAADKKVKEFNKVVAARKAASRQAERDNPRS